MRTYGQMICDRTHGVWWELEAEPHVVMKLKRVFARVKGSARTLRLLHTQEVARDLQWFVERYPLKISADDLAFLNGEATAHVEKTERFVRVLDGSDAPRAFELALPPRDYQRIAADLALQSGGLLIADEVGVGKTVQAICMFTDPRTLPALVVTLTHLPSQWKREIERFAPGLRVHILKKGTPYPLPECDIIISNYHKLNGWAPVLAGVVKCVVFDEAHELRHTGSLRYNAATAIAHDAHYRLGLTATPIFNFGSEFYSVVDVLRPDALGSREEFLQEWCKGTESMSGQSAISDPKAFGAYLREQGVMIRRTRADVKRELPGCTVIPHTIESDDALQGVEGAAELAQFILSREGHGIAQMQARGELDWKLRQATGIAKARFVADFVRMLVESGERVLLYGWHHAVYDIWCERLANLGVVKFTGEESPSQKELARIAFETGGAKVLVMSLRAGAGLDGLQNVCSTVVFGELDWSPAVHEQATGRVYRDGQQSPVMAYYLVSNEGSDPVIESTLGLKRAQLDGVRNPDGRDIAETVKHKGVLELARAVLRKKGLPLAANSQVAE